MSPLKGHFLSAGKPTHKLACFIQSRIFRDAYKREQFAKYEVERRALRFIIASNQFNARQKTEAQLQLTQLPFPFRLAALAGDLPGVKKASW
ncbi:40S ribosomal protein mrp2, mitochondrial [Orbilia oligospora]|uniref:40S ribosomal protein mrp2, mitochondrial n=1 Tax=Orbilia oligospora TaxID=2813651 RepID=A0A7C8NUH4_ORBOL|nr:40S ribosomal protein mrp2, mitochondrial [Orbilia oligospora]KAF3202521.1 40S ribosomal protein mrp2, mitochondrial [Orbilia oligospora]